MKKRSKKKRNAYGQGVDSGRQGRGFRFVACPYCSRRTGRARRCCRCVFWCGSARLSDGKVEEAHFFFFLQAADFHTDFYFSVVQEAKIESGESVFFWVTEEGKVEVSWNGPPRKGILPEIRKQITVTGRNRPVAGGCAQAGNGRRFPFSAGRKEGDSRLRRFQWKIGQWQRFR